MPLLTDPAPQLEIIAIAGLPEISNGAPLVEYICHAITSNGVSVRDGDIFVLAQKIVSKAEGRMVELKNVIPSPFATSLAESTGKDARHVEVILQESKRIVRMDAGLIISETHHGFVCANAGVDSSNVLDGSVVLLPLDPDVSAQRLRQELIARTGKLVAVIISDTFGRPWREGLTNVAIGVAGLNPLLDYRGQRDGEGHSLAATVIAVADELASAAELVMGKLARRPAAIVRNYKWVPEEGKASAMVRPRETDLFR